jgi:hypothetical protein
MLLGDACADDRRTPFPTLNSNAYCVMLQDGMNIQIPDET